ncbi:MAG TPA: hypothetical protein VGO68_13725 [Pyrinomonadaceae bacterium]|jgi:hypothetical protein|nr:hypothetical protein [Pyrinomonadaceae bacterium]
MSKTAGTFSQPATLVIDNGFGESGRPSSNACWKHQLAKIRLLMKHRQDIIRR